MAIILEQQPGFKTCPAGQNLMYVISEDTGILMNEQMVKVNAHVFVVNNFDGTDPIHQSVYSSVPNNAGVAMFDLGPILQNYVNVQKNGVLSTTPSAASSFQTTPYDERLGYHSIHNIDKYCMGDQVVKYAYLFFQIEYLGANPLFPDIVSQGGGTLMADKLLIYNGIVYRDDVLSYGSALNTPDFGLDLDGEKAMILNSNRAKFLTDMPSTINARLEDFGTVAFFNNLNVNSYSFATTGNPDYGIELIQFKLYNDAGILYDQYTMNNFNSTGGWSGIFPDGGQMGPDSMPAKVRYLFSGVFPANQRGWSAKFNAAISNPDGFPYYTFQAFSQEGSACSQLYRVNIIEDCIYEPVRLAWLNKYGAWDYYTFMKKNVRTLESKRTQYHKLDGTWNEAQFNLNKNQGGKKTFQTITTEKLRLNSDYLTEDEAVWMEQLMTANEVLIVLDYFNAVTNAVINRFTEPVILNTKSFTKKTRANDRLIQYTFEVEKSLDKKSQGA